MQNNIRVNTNIMNICRIEDVFQWLIEDGESKQKYPKNDATARFILDKIKSGIHKFGPAFLMVDRDRVVASIVNKVDSFHKKAWMHAEFVEMTNLGFTRIVFYDYIDSPELDSPREVFSTEIKASIGSLGLSEGEKFRSEYVYGFST